MPKAESRVSRRCLLVKDGKSQKLQHFVGKGKSDEMATIKYIPHRPYMFHFHACLHVSFVQRHDFIQSPDMLLLWSVICYVT